MDKVLISNAQGESGIVNVVRYFMNNGLEYLIYSLNEVDEAGYTRLYVAKLNGIDGVYNADTLNDSEWNEIKNLVKLIVKANKEGLPVPVQDLNPKKINNIILKDKKVFKLNAPLVIDLGNNRPSFETESDDAGNQKNMFEVPNNPMFDIPSAPTFDTPAQQAFEIPSAPTFDTPAQPAFEIPSAPTFDTPAQPAFEMPSAPTFDTPAQPAFEMPSAPTFDTPAQPAFEIPSAPTFDTPAQPVFEMPSAPTFDAPAQPAFEIPSAPTFDTPAQSAFEMPSAPTFDTNNMQHDIMDNSSVDYKALYNEEMLKNQNMQEQLAKLNEEIAKYKNIISNVKNVIEE